MWGTPTGLSLNRLTIADSMRNLGYDTHLVGKWHVGDCNEAYLPTNRGFDTFYGIMGAMGDYVKKVHDFNFMISPLCYSLKNISIDQYF